MSGSEQPRFHPGDTVRVSDREHDGHHRTPWYVKGKIGTVAVYNGSWLNPETRGHGGSGLPKVPVYRVAFSQADLWDGYDGPVQDSLIMDIFQNWLEPVQEGSEA